MLPVIIIIIIIIITIIDVTIIFIALPYLLYLKPFNNVNVLPLIIIMPASLCKFHKFNQPLKFARNIENILLASTYENLFQDCLVSL